MDRSETSWDPPCCGVPPHRSIFISIRAAFDSARTHSQGGAEDTHRQECEQGHGGEQQTSTIARGAALSKSWNTRWLMGGKYFNSVNTGERYTRRIPENIYQNSRTGRYLSWRIFQDPRSEIRSLMWSSTWISIRAAFDSARTHSMVRGTPGTVRPRGAIRIQRGMSRDTGRDSSPAR